MPGIASSAPAVLIAHLAGLTQRIRLGSGGVMLPNHAPLVIAEQFGMLEALHPGRIDLGIGRAPGTDPRTAAALRRTQSLREPDLPEQLGELYGFFNGTFPDDHPYRAITAVPARGNQPAIWLLGSSDYSARLAGLLGLPFSFAHHFAAGQHPAGCRRVPPQLPPLRGAGRAVRHARRRRPLRRHLRAGDLPEQARLTSPSCGCGRVGPGPFPTPEEADAFHPTPHEKELIRSWSGSRIVGEPGAVARGAGVARGPHGRRRADDHHDGPRPRRSTAVVPPDRRAGRTRACRAGGGRLVPEGDTLHRTAARLKPALEGHVLTRFEAPRLLGDAPQLGAAHRAGRGPRASTC